MNEKFVRLLEDSYDTVCPKGSEEDTNRKIAGMAKVRDSFWKGMDRKRKRQMKPVKPTVPSGVIDTFQGTVPVGLG